MLTYPALGFPDWDYASITTTQSLPSAPPVDWFEVLTENYLVPGGKPLDYLDAYP